MNDLPMVNTPYKGKIDKRRKYYIVLDTETGNGIKEGEKLNLDYSLVYDCGFAVVDKTGKVYEMWSFINYDIFFGMSDIMKTCYYAEKLPQYFDDLHEGTRKITNTYGMKKALKDTIERFNVGVVACHNARFDVKALNNTIRYTTSSKYRYFIPYDIEIWDTLKMSRDVILKMPTYKMYAEWYNLKTATGRMSATAESLYRFITKEPEFIEKHTALEDVLIEKDILTYCLKQHKKMRKKLFEKKY